MSKQAASFELLLSSTKDELKKTTSFVESVSKYASLSENDKYDLLLILSEAVTNAVIHGNKKEEAKKVEIKCQVKTEEIHILVKDEGSGFSPDHLPNPLDKKNLFKESGRGVFLMKKIAHSVNYTFSSTGTTLDIVLKRQP